MKRRACVIGAVSLTAAFSAHRGGSQTILPQRIRLTEDVVFHVSPKGDDAGGEGSKSKPWRTPQGAWDYIKANIDMAGRSAMVQLAPYNSYPGFTGAGSLLGQGMAATLKFSGGGRGVIIDGVMVADDGGMFAVQNLKFRGGIYSQESSLIVVLGGCDFATWKGFHISAQIGGRVVVAGGEYGGYSISGDAKIHWSADVGGKILMLNPATIQQVNDPQFEAWAWGSAGALLNASGLKVIGRGNEHGISFRLSQSSFITGTGGNRKLFPGKGGYIGAGCGYS